MSSSPVIYKDSVIVQADLLGDEGSFIAAFDVKTGKQLWRTPRDEVPSWSTPFLYEGSRRTELITTATRFARAYDPATGKELWRLGNHATTMVPSPIAGDGLIFLASGNSLTIQPIYAIRPGATGDITLKEGENTNEAVTWSQRRGGAYAATPVFYDGLLYIVSSGGVLTAYNAETGERAYQERLAPGSYYASGVGADGKLYFASEDGDVTVVKAGPTYERLAQNSMGAPVFATPAISQNMIIIRTQHYLVAVEEIAPR
jgi:outer membrane protein assembly factor BamB